LDINFKKFVTGFLLISLFFPFSFSNVEAESILVSGTEVTYEIEEGTVTSIELDPDFIELLVNIITTGDGTLQISIPRILLDAKFDVIDDIFFVIIDGFETEYVELVDVENSRTILIPFFLGDKQIEIIGTDALEVVFEEQEIKIPQWIKNDALWWSEDLIQDSDFVLGIQFLITEGIMKIPPTESGSNSGIEIPDWIKNNAGWWAADLISDQEFVSGIQFLITNGIMSV